MKKYNVIVVGAGPAGVSAAIRLRRRGIDCLLIDKHSFPREKTCGGLLTLKSLALIEDLAGTPLPDEIIRQRIYDVDIQYQGKQAASLHVAEGFALCHRRELDNWLLEVYRSLGGRFLSGTALRHIDREAHSIRCENGEEFAYSHLIGADGALSFVRKSIGLAQPTFALGVETQLPAGQAPGSRIVLDVGILPDGYAWIFPKQETLTVGMACTQSKDVSYQTHLDAYVREVCGYPRDYKTRGALLPYGQGMPVFTAEDVMLVGDAAGFNDPVTGEGIYYALLSGTRAADAIADCASAPEQAYAAVCRDILSQMRCAGKQTRFFYRHRRWVLKLASRHTGLLSYFCNRQTQWNAYPGSLLPLVKDYYAGKRKKL